MAKPLGTEASAHSLQSRLISQLQFERRLHGHGSAAELDARIQKSVGYLGRVLRGEIGLQTEMLFKILEAFRVEPAEFFTSLTGRDFSARRCLERYSRVLSPEYKEAAISLPETLRQALNRILRGHDPRALDRSPGDREDPALLAEAKRLDDSRYSMLDVYAADMGRLLGAAYRAYAAGRASGAALGTVLGVAAVAERNGGHPGVALFFLRVALAVVPRSSREQVVLLVEAAYLLASQHQLPTSRLIEEQAQRRAIVLGDLHLLGKTLLVQGLVAFYQQRSKSALRSYEASLQYLEPSAWQARFMAHQGAALCHLRQGELRQAGKQLELARKQHQTRQGLHWARLLWTTGHWTYSAAKTSDGAEEALRLYEKALAILERAHQPLETVILHFQSAQILMKLGAKDRLNHVAAALLQLTRQLKKQPTIDGLILQFATRTMKGQLTEAWLREALGALDRSCRSIPVRAG